MENQHQKIKGYRDLSQGEIDLMNKIKAHGEATDKLLEEVAAHLETQTAAAKGNIEECNRLGHAQPHRWVRMAADDLQVGTMKLVRAVAQPSTF